MSCIFMSCNFMSGIFSQPIVILAGGHYDSQVDEEPAVWRQTRDGSRLRDERNSTGEDCRSHGNRTTSESSTYLLLLPKYGIRTNRGVVAHAYRKS